MGVRSAESPEELSPLREIEQRVQARAKEISLDMGGADGGAKLRALIDDEVAAWSRFGKQRRRRLLAAPPRLKKSASGQRAKAC